MPQRVQTVFAGRSSEGRWPGAVSVPENGPGRTTLIDGLDDYYVPVDPGAPTRCIDGRHDPAVLETALGAQAPGGATGVALSYRLGVDRDDATRGTLLSDAHAMLSAYNRLGMTPGGHRDDGDATGGRVGCGALDGLDNVLACLLDPTLVDDHKRLVRLLLDRDFDRDHYLRILGTALVLRSRWSEYFTDRATVLDLLERNHPGSVPVLKGEHREGVVVVNLVPGTTLASNRFSADHDQVQAFGYDLWRTQDVARALMPLPSRAVDRSRFVHARVMLTVATLMALTDGSLPLVLRLPIDD